MSLAMQAACRSKLGAGIASSLHAAHTCAPSPVLDGIHHIVVIYQGFPLGPVGSEDLSLGDIEALRDSVRDAETNGLIVSLGLIDQTEEALPTFQVDPPVVQRTFICTDPVFGDTGPPFKPCVTEQDVLEFVRSFADATPSNPPTLILIRFMSPIDGSIFEIDAAIQDEYPLAVESGFISVAGQPPAFVYDGMTAALFTLKAFALANPLP